MIKEIESKRKEIDKITEKIIKLIAERRNTVLEIGRIKKKKGLPILDEKREKQLMLRARNLSKKFKLPPALIEEITKILIENSRRLQEK